MEVLRELCSCSVCLDALDNPRILPCLHSFCEGCLLRHFEIYKIKYHGKLCCPECRELLHVGVVGLLGTIRSDCSQSKIDWMVKDLSLNVNATDVETTSEGETPNGATGGNPSPLLHEAGLLETVERLNSLLIAARNKLVQMHELEHIMCSMLPQDSMKDDRSHHHKLNEKKMVKIQSQLEGVRQEQDGLYEVVKELKPVRDVLSSIYNRGSEWNCVKVSELLNELSPLLTSSFPSKIDLDKLSKKYITSKTKSTSGSLMNVIRFEKGLHEHPHAQLIRVIGCRGNAPGQFCFPTHVSLLPDGGFMVCDKNNFRIQVFNGKGDLVSILLEKSVKPRRARFNPHDGLLYVSDEIVDCVKVFKYGERGALLRRIGENFFKCPAGLDITQEGNLIMTDAEKRYIVVYNSQGDILTKFYHGQLFDKLISAPYFICTNEDGELIVSDFRNQTVKIFSASGKLMNTITGLAFPRGVCVDAFSNILVAEGDRHCVSMFDSLGKFVKIVVNERDGLLYPMSIAVTPDGQLIVTQCGYFTDHEIRIFQIY